MNLRFFLILAMCINVGLGQYSELLPINFNRTTGKGLHDKLAFEILIREAPVNCKMRCLTSDSDHRLIISGIYFDSDNKLYYKHTIYVKDAEDERISFYATTLEKVNQKTAIEHYAYFSKRMKSVRYDFKEPIPQIITGVQEVVLEGHLQSSALNRLLRAELVGHFSPKDSQLVNFILPEKSRYIKKQWKRLKIMLEVEKIDKDLDKTEYVEDKLLGF